jgi:hypothetical protein
VPTAISNSYWWMRGGSITCTTSLFDTQDKTKAFFSTDAKLICPISVIQDMTNSLTYFKDMALDQVGNYVVESVSDSRVVYDNISEIHAKIDVSDSIESSTVHFDHVKTTTIDQKSVIDTCTKSVVLMVTCDTVTTQKSFIGTVEHSEITVQNGQTMNCTESFLDSVTSGLITVGSMNSMQHQKIFGDVSLSTVLIEETETLQVDTFADDTDKSAFTFRFDNVKCKDTDIKKSKLNVFASNWEGDSFKASDSGIVTVENSSIQIKDVDYTDSVLDVRCSTFTFDNLTGKESRIDFEGIDAINCKKIDLTSTTFRHDGKVVTTSDNVKLTKSIFDSAGFKTTSDAEIKLDDSASRLQGSTLEGTDMGLDHSELICKSIKVDNIGKEPSNGGGEDSVGPVLASRILGTIDCKVIDNTNKSWFFPGSVTCSDDCTIENTYVLGLLKSPTTTGTNSEILESQSGDVTYENCSINKLVGLKKQEEGQEPPPDEEEAEEGPLFADLTKCHVIEIGGTEGKDKGGSVTAEDSVIHKTVIGAEGDNSIFCDVDWHIKKREGSDDEDPETKNKGYSVNLTDCTVLKAKVIYETKKEITADNSIIYDLDTEVKDGDSIGEGADTTLKLTDSIMLRNKVKCEVAEEEITADNSSILELDWEELQKCKKIELTDCSVLKSSLNVQKMDEDITLNNVIFVDMDEWEVQKCKKIECTDSHLLRSMVTANNVEEDISLNNSSVTEMDWTVQTGSTMDIIDCN